MSESPYEHIRRGIRQDTEAEVKRLRMDAQELNLFAQQAANSLDELLGEVWEICDARGYITKSTLEVARVAMALLKRPETAEEYFSHMEIQED